MNNGLWYWAGSSKLTELPSTKFNILILRHLHSYQNLQNINSALSSSCNGHSRKRLLCDNDDDEDYEKSAKQSNGIMARKLHDMLVERETSAKR
jgi:hypothetical protein